MQHPWRVSSEISDQKDSKQNISHHFALIYKTKTLPELSMEYCEPDEVSDLKWIQQVEINNFEFAFGHSAIIQAFLDKEKMAGFT